MAFRGGYPCYTFDYDQLDNHRGGFIVSLPTGIMTNLDAVGQYDVIRKSGFDSVLSIFVLRHALGIDCDKYNGAEHLFLRYDFSTKDM